MSLKSIFIANWTPLRGPNSVLDHGATAKLRFFVKKHVLRSFETMLGILTDTHEKRKKHTFSQD